MRMPLRTALVMLALFTPVLAAAQKLDKEDRAWLDAVRPVMLADEDKTYRALKEKADRLEFQKIFWARRNADLEGTDNAFRALVEKRKAEVDAAIHLQGRPASETDCGRTYILLGAPDAKEPVSVNPLVHTAETWIYRDRPGQTFKGGEARIAFDSTCLGGGDLKASLDRVAESKIQQPNLAYRFDKDQRLVKLVDMLPKPTPGQALLKTPRQDFGVSVQKTFLRDASGGTAILGVVRGEAAGLGAEESGGARRMSVVTVANVEDEGGKVKAFAEQTSQVRLEADGAFVTSFQINVSPGKYTLRAGALDPKTGKGSLVSDTVEAPDLNHGELAVASLVLLRRVEEKATADPQNPFEAFHLGDYRLIPAFGSSFTKAEELSIFYQCYDLKVDATSGKAAGIAGVTILRDGKGIVARAPEQTFDTPLCGNIIGPVSLASYQPGHYVVKLRVKDTLANLERVQEAPLEIRP
jgi:GWxTD domain-containing protein